MPRRLVADLMASNVCSLPGSASVLEAACLMSDLRIGAIVIVEEGRLSPLTVIASGATPVIARSGATKQSSLLWVDCFVALLLAMTPFFFLTEH